jgi:hypothetical protein
MVNFDLVYMSTTMGTPQSSKLHESISIGGGAERKRGWLGQRGAMLGQAKEV